jgi:plasmid replication initiation protein
MQLLQIPKDKTIMQHNMITSGRYDFTACQLDILFLLLASFEKDDPADKKYDLYVRDIEAITGRQWQYNQLQEATENMGIRMFSIETSSYLEQMWLFNGFRYMKGKGYFTASISSDARRYLFDLKNNFTRIQLNAVLSCSSKYAKRLYALACQWRTVGKIEMPIDKLKEMLYLKDPEGKEKEQFRQLGQFREKVLDIAKRQINEHTDVRFDYELKKCGRSFETIILYIDYRKERQLTIDFNQSIDFQKKVSVIAGYGVAKEAATLIAKSNFSDFEKLIEQLLVKVKKDPEIDIPAYIVGVFQKKGVLQKR